MTVVSPRLDTLVELVSEEGISQLDGQRRGGRALAWRAAPLAAIAALTAGRQLWVVQLLQLGLLLVVPGALLLDALRVPRAAVRAFPVYVPAASVAVLFASALAGDLVGPPLGVGHPLAPWPMLVSLELACAALLAARPSAPVLAMIGSALVRARPLKAWPLALPLLAAAGALELNHHGAAALSIASAVAAALVPLVCLVRADKIGPTSLMVILYAVGLAAIWSLTIRSPYPFGFDIATEAHDAARTVQDGVWNTSHPHDPYEAMLSLTLLPALLHELAGVSTDAVLKLVYPAMLALVPVGVFAIASRHLRRWYAFLAAAILIGQGFLVASIPTVGRQEIGIVVFASLVAAILEPTAARRWQWPLIGALSATLVLSHYTSAYIAIIVFALALMLELARSALSRVPRATPAIVLAVLTTTAAAIVWYGPVTGSTSNLRSFVSGVQNHGVALLPSSKGHDALTGYLFGNIPAALSATDYSVQVADWYRQQKPYVDPLPSASTPRYALRGATPPGGATRSKVLSQAAGDLQAVASQLINLLALIAAIALLVLGRTRLTATERKLGALAGATLGLLALSRLSGTVASDYNQERAFAQALVILAPAMAWMVQRRARGRPKPGRFSLAAITAIYALLLSATLGLTQLVVGRGSPVRFANSGEDYERLYTTAPELAAAAWISQAPRGSLLYADRYGQLRLLEADGLSYGVLGDITPSTLDGHAWVYASATNVLDRRARVQFAGSYVLYGWPTAFLADKFDIVYDNGTAEVLHR